MVWQEWHPCQSAQPLSLRQAHHVGKVTRLKQRTGAIHVHLHRPDLPQYLDEEHGVFTSALLEGLRGEAAEGSTITLRSLFNHTYKTVQKKTNKRQNPLLIGNMANNTVIFQSRGLKKSPSLSR